MKCRSGMIAYYVFELQVPQATHDHSEGIVVKSCWLGSPWCRKIYSPCLTQSTYVALNIYHRSWQWPEFSHDPGNPKVPWLSSCRETVTTLTIHDDVDDSELTNSFRLSELVLYEKLLLPAGLLVLNAQCVLRHLSDFLFPRAYQYIWSCPIRNSGPG